MAAADGAIYTCRCGHIGRDWRLSGTAMLTVRQAHPEGDFVTVGAVRLEPLSDHADTSYSRSPWRRPSALRRDWNGQ